VVGKVRGLDLDAALDWLRNNAGRKAEHIPEDISIVPRRATLGGFRMPGYRHGLLRTWVTPARRYAEKRGLTDAQVKRWHLGYSVEGRLFGRLIFPIYSETAKPLSYHARAFTDDPKRYLYPHKSERPDLGAIFGQGEWVDVQPPNELVVTEGALNALACERAGTKFIGAIGGSETSINPPKLLRLAQWSRIAVASDNDEPGDRMFEMLRRSLYRTSTVRRIPFPEGKDANDLDVAELRELLRD
jgi:DNA primase